MIMKTKIKMLLIVLFLITISVDTVEAYGMDEYENRKLELERVKYCIDVYDKTMYRGEFNSYQETTCRDVFKILNRKEIERQQLLIKNRLWK